MKTWLKQRLGGARQVNKSRRLSAVPRLAWRPFGGLLGPALSDAGQSLAALAFLAVASLFTGFTFAFFTDVLNSYPGLLLFIPAAIGLRGNIFGPLGSRLSTSISAGTFSWSYRFDSLLGQNVIASLVSSMLAAFGLALLAKGLVMVLVDSADAMSLSDFVVVSVLGGLLASLVVLAITLGLAVASARFGLDLDNVTAPLVSAAGDFVTLPSIVITTVLIDRGGFTDLLAVGLALVVVVCMIPVWKKSFSLVRRIVLEAMPTLAVAGCLSLIAGVVLERSLDKFLNFSVLIILLPGYLSIGGALGGILANRLSTKVHLGLIEPARIPRGNAREDIRITFFLAVPIFVLLALLAGSFGIAAGRTSPGLGILVAVALTGGLIATAFVAVVAYYGTLLVVKFGLDPDNHGIPLVSSALDVVGAATLISALLVWGVA